MKLWAFPDSGMDLPLHTTVGCVQTRRISWCQITAFELNCTKPHCTMENESADIITVTSPAPFDLPRTLMSHQLCCSCAWASVVERCLWVEQMFGWTTSWPSEMNQNHTTDALEYGGAKTPPSPWSSLLSPNLLLPFSIPSCLWFFCQRSLTVISFGARQCSRNILAVHMLLSASCHSQKQKQLLPWDMLNKIMLVVGGFFCAFFGKTFPLWDNWLGVNTPSSAVRDCNPIPTKYRAGIAWCRYWYF